MYFLSAVCCRSVWNESCTISEHSRRKCINDQFIYVILLQDDAANSDDVAMAVEFFNHHLLKYDLVLNNVKHNYQSARSRISDPIKTFFVLSSKKPNSKGEHSTEDKNPYISSIQKICKHLLATRHKWVRNNIVSYNHIHSFLDESCAGWRRIGHRRSGWSLGKRCWSKIHVIPYIGVYQIDKKLRRQIWNISCEHHLMLYHQLFNEIITIDHFRYVVNIRSRPYAVVI